MPAVSHHRALAGVVGGAALAVTAAACGSSSTGAAAPARPAATHTASVLVKTATKGSLGTVLVDGRGLTLYRFTPDQPGAIACTGGCATVWPPLLVPAGGSPQAGPGVSGLGTAARPDGGTQVTYRGMPLYYYAKDKDAGDTYGQGVGGKWFVVNPAGTGSTGSGANGGAGASTTSTGANGGNSYGY